MTLFERVIRRTSKHTVLDPHARGSDPKIFKSHCLRSFRSWERCEDLQITFLINERNLEHYNTAICIFIILIYLMIGTNHETLSNKWKTFTKLHILNLFIVGSSNYIALDPNTVGSIKESSNNNVSVASVRKSNPGIFKSHRFGSRSSWERWWSV